MNRIKTMSILVLSFICLQANGQKLSTEQVQNNIDKVFELNKKMETKIASWRDWDIRLSPDSVVFLKNDYTNVILDLINNTEKEATPQQNVLLQYYKLAVSKNNLSLLRLNGYMQEAKEFSKNYEEVLAYKPKLDGMAITNGVLRNISRDKIDILQYKYLYQIHLLAHDLKDKPLMVSTSKRLIMNKRASIYNQSVAALYLFNNEITRSKKFDYGVVFIEKYAVFSDEERGKFNWEAILAKDSFSAHFFQAAVNKWTTNKEDLKAQEVIRLSDVGERAELNQFDLYMKGVLVVMGEISRKSKIKTLLEQAKVLNNKTLVDLFELHLKE